MYDCRDCGSVREGCVKLCYSSHLQSNILTLVKIDQLSGVYIINSILGVRGYPIFINTKHLLLVNSITKVALLKIQDNGQFIIAPVSFKLIFYASRIYDVCRKNVYQVKVINECQERPKNASFRLCLPLSYLK